MTAVLSRSRVRSLSVTDTTDGAEVATLADDGSLATTLAPLLLLLILGLLLLLLLVLLGLLLVLQPPSVDVVGVEADAEEDVDALAATTGMISTEDDDDVLIEDNPTCPSDSQDTVAGVVGVADVATGSTGASDRGVASSVSGFDLTSDEPLLEPLTVSSSDSTVQFDLRFRSRPLLTLDGLRITLPVNKRQKALKEKSVTQFALHTVAQLTK